MSASNMQAIACPDKIYSWSQFCRKTLPFLFNPCPLQYLWTSKEIFDIFNTHDVNVLAPPFRMPIEQIRFACVFDRSTCQCKCARTNTCGSIGHLITYVIENVQLRSFIGISRPIAGNAHQLFFSRYRKGHPVIILHCANEPLCSPKKPLI